MSEQPPSQKQFQFPGNQSIQDDQARFFLASIIDTMKDSVVTINFEGIITSWNKSAEILYGYPAKEAIGQSLHMLMHQEDFGPLRKSIETIRQGNKVPVYHTLRLHKNGSDLHLLVTLSPVLDEEENVIGLSTVARDMTDLNTAREDLAISRSRLKAIIEAAVDFAIITIDPAGKIMDWSSGAEKMFGYSADEAIAQHVELIYTSEDRQSGIPTVEIELAVKTGRSLDERWHLHKDGSRFFMSGVLTPITEGPVEGFVKVGRNITDRKMAEEALLLAEERKSLAVHSARMGEWEYDVLAETVKISEEINYLFGISLDQRMLSFDSLFEYIYPADRAGVREQLQAALDGILIFQAEYRMIRQDNNDIIWVNTYGRVIAHEGDRASRMIGVIFDITPRKQLETQKDDFISLASHELRTPVTAIKAYSEIFQEILEESGNAENIILLQKFNVQVERLTKLIQNLLDSSTLTEGKMHLNPETFDLNETINEQIEPFQRIAGDRKIRWEPAPVALVHADRDRIIQVIANFVSNAVKYSKENQEILINTEDKLDSVMVRVTDHGEGIANEMQLQVFERYYRAPGNPHKQEGFGLGLYICAAIIRQHMGSIGVDSAPGEGSTFYFTLPYG